MKHANLRLRTFVALLLVTISCFGQKPSGGSGVDWRALVQNRLPLYGHRNWIIVADSAFPVYAGPGIETIVVNDDLPTVLNYVAKAISSSRHVRATVFLDKELDFVEDLDYAGASELKKQILSTFSKEQVSSIPHSQVLSKIDEAGKTFRILFIKTTATIPYTSVYMRLDCGYMSDDVDRRIKDRMSKAEKAEHDTK
ncbi:MAG TPA: RbsD/FucU domain-containing protein [Dongiaceae bacterium]|nr:RbsD/FucU domain-containing protein [Dongiaceae bacterium]